MSPPIEVVAFDADDTLWHNESIFHAVQGRFRALLADYHSSAFIDERLEATERRNLAHFGYGVKGFTLSMIETAVELTEGRIAGAAVQEILGLGRWMLAHPVDLLEGVRATVELVAQAHRVVLVTKGDLLDQESKLARSGLGPLFSAVEIVSEKNAPTYSTVMGRLGVAPDRFLMVGNSLRSDVLPVLEAGGRAVHIPYALTWAHEAVGDQELAGKTFVRLGRIGELPGWLLDPHAGL